jgi:hypothetical protein
VAIDINQYAARSVAENAIANQLEDCVMAVASNLLSAIAPRPLFDVIMSSPPSFPGEPLDLADRAWFAGPNYRDIACLFDQARERLAPGGSFYILLSSDSDLVWLGALIKRAGFRARRVAERSYASAARCANSAGWGRGAAHTARHLRSSSASAREDAKESGAASFPARLLGDAAPNITAADVKARWVAKLTRVSRPSERPSISIRHVDARECAPGPRATRARVPPRIGAPTATGGCSYSRSRRSLRKV